MKFDHATVIFKSSEVWYEVERKGAKPNTVRLMSPDDYLRLAEYNPRHIRIQLGEDEHTCFTRTVKSIFRLGKLLGQVLVIVSWVE
jgi:hypothetical protein